MFLKRHKTHLAPRLPCSQLADVATPQGGAGCVGGGRRGRRGGGGGGAAVGHLGAGAAAAALPGGLATLAGH